MQSGNVINELNKSLTSESDDNLFKEFCDRIQTFIDGQKWIKKPPRLSPSICSQYGWKCIKINLLECVTCGAKLSAPDSKIGNFDSYKACLEKTISNLKESHGKYCPWPITPSPETFVKMSLMPKEEALSQFLKRVQSSLLFKNSFPEIKESVIAEMGFSEKEILALCKLAGIKVEDACLYGKSVLSVAAAGWIIIEEEDLKKPFLKCNHCLRSIWCGWFSLLNSENNQDANDKASTTNTAAASENAAAVASENGAAAATASENGAADATASENSAADAAVSENEVNEISSNDKETIEEPPSKKMKLSTLKKGEPFDPLYEHRPWCLWIQNGLDNYSSELNDKENKDCPDETSELPGWKIFVKSLLKNISDTQTLKSNESPSKEQIRNVKSLLEQWSNVV